MDWKPRVCDARARDSSRTRRSHRRSDQLRVDSDTTHHSNGQWTTDSNSAERGAHGGAEADRSTIRAQPLFPFRVLSCSALLSPPLEFALLRLSPPSSLSPLSPRLVCFFARDSPPRLLPPSFALPPYCWSPVESGGLLLSPSATNPHPPHSSPAAAAASATAPATRTGAGVGSSTASASQSSVSRSLHRRGDDASSLAPAHTVDAPAHAQRRRRKRKDQASPSRAPTDNEAEAATSSTHAHTQSHTPQRDRHRAREREESHSRQAAAASPSSSSAAATASSISPTRKHKSKKSKRHHKKDSTTETGEQMSAADSATAPAAAGAAAAGAAPSKHHASHSAAASSAHPSASTSALDPDDPDLAILTDEYHSHAAAAASSSAMVARRSAPIVTPAGFELERTSLVRLLTQTLGMLGYEGAASSLQRESGVELESRSLAHFRRAVLAGDWDGARSALEHLAVGSHANKTAMRKLLAEQKYISMIEQALRIKDDHTDAHAVAKQADHKTNGATGYSSNGHSAAASSTAASTSGLLMQAVQFLQSTLMPLYAHPSKPGTAAASASATGAAAQAAPPPDPHVMHLASLFTCASITALQSTYRGSAILSASSGTVAAAASGSASIGADSPYLPLFQRLSSYLPSHSRLQSEHHLLHLLDSSLQAQIAQCRFHQHDDHLRFDLSDGNPCTLTLPTAPMLSLTDHEDEVLYVAFSHPQKGSDAVRLATCSKGVIRIFELKTDAAASNGHAATANGAGKKSGIEEEKHAANGAAKHASNGFAHAPSASASSSSSSAAVAAPASSHSHASRLEFVCTSLLQPPSVSRPSTPSPSSSSSDSPRHRSGGASDPAPPPYFSVQWSPDNQHILACNGVDVSVFSVQDGVCMLTVGATAVDNLASAAAAGQSGAQAAASSETQAVALPARPATASGSRGASAAVASPSVAPAAAAPPPPPSAYAALHSAFAPHLAAHLAAAASSSSSSSPSSSAMSPIAQNLARVSQLLSSPLLASMGLRAHLLEPAVGDSSSDHDHVIGHAEPVTSCAWCADGASFVTGSADRRLILWDLAGEILDVWTGEMVNEIAIAGDRMLVATPHNKAVLFQIKDRRIEEIAVLHETSNIASICLSDDGRLALVSVIRPAELHLWDLGPVREAYEWPATAPPVSVSSSIAAAAAASAPPAPSLQGSPAVSPSPPSLVRRYTGFHAHRYIVRSCFGGGSNSLLLSGSEDGLLYVWQRESGELLAKLRGHTATINSVAAARVHGRYIIASASDDHTVLLWNIKAQPGHSHHKIHTAHKHA